MPTSYAPFVGGDKDPSTGLLKSPPEETTGNPNAAVQRGDVKDCSETETFGTFDRLASDTRHSFTSDGAGAFTPDAAGVHASDTGKRLENELSNDYARQSDLNDGDGDGDCKPGSSSRRSSFDGTWNLTKNGIENKSFVPDSGDIGTEFSCDKSINSNRASNSHYKNSNIQMSRDDFSRPNFEVQTPDSGLSEIRNECNESKVEVSGFDNYVFTANANVLDHKKAELTVNDSKNEAAHSVVCTEQGAKIRHPQTRVLRRAGVNERPALRNQILGAIAGSLIHFGLGTIVGLSGVVLPALVDPISEDLVLTPHQATLFSSLMNIGALVGSVMSGPLMVFWGQRVTLLIALPAAAAGWLLMAFTPSVWLLQTARLLLGFITGIYGGPSANYVAEISHTSLRGRLAGMVDLFRQLGFLFVYVVGSSGLSWRQTSMVCGAVTTVVPFLVLFSLPNSPRWLATRSRVSEARESLKFYRGPDYVVDEELKDINQQLQKANKQLSTKDQLMVCKKPPVMKILVVLIFMFFMYQFSGNFSMIVFSVTIFQSAQSTIGEYSSTIITGVVRVFGVLAYISLADKIGRKTLLISSSVLGGLAMGVMGLYFYLRTLNVDLSQIQWLPLASMAVFIFFTCVTEPALILLRAELLPTSVRSVGVPIIYTFFFLGAFLVSYLYPLMVERIGSHGTFWTYAVDGLAMALVGAIFIPETISKSLEDIEKDYEKKKEEKELCAINNASK